jgi:hypothetical protein
MYESHDHTESLVREVRFEFEQELPEPIDHWSLGDFSDIVPSKRYVS